MEDQILIIAAVFEDGREFVWNRDDTPAWFLDALVDNKVTKLFHNAPFELSFFLRDWKVEVENVWDTLAIERMLTAGLREHCDLANTAARRLGIKLDKSVRERFAYGMSAVGAREREYCLMDARVLIDICRKQSADVRELNQQRAAYIENSMGPVIAEMQVVGMPFDAPLWEQQKESVRVMRDAAQLAAWDALGSQYWFDLFGEATGGINLRSRPIMLEVLADRGLVLDNYNIESLLEYKATGEDSELVSLASVLLEYKKWDSALSRDFLKHVGRDGRVHASFNAQGARTFRFTSKEPNMLNVARPISDDINFRHLFRARPGWVIVGADYSQIEFRIMAEVAGEPAYVSAFVEGRDPHEETAKMIFGRELRSKEERDLGKVVNFGNTAYGGGPNALRSTALKYGIVLTEVQAKKYLSAVRKQNTHIERWSRQQYESMVVNGYLEVPSGHRRYMRKENKPTTARNTPIQMFAAVIFKVALDRIRRALRREGLPAHLILGVHDEVVLEAREDAARDVQGRSDH